MYIPRTNAEERPEVLAAFMRAHPLATLVSVGPAGELWATHLPVVYDAARGPHGTIEGHVARGETAARLLCMCTPAGQEEFFREVGVPLPTRTSPPPRPDPDVRARTLARTLELAPRYRSEILLP